MKRIVFVASVLTGLIISSCATNNVASNGLIQKRKHNKGFHLNFPSKVSDSEAKEGIASNDIKSSSDDIIVKNSAIENKLVVSEVKSADIDYAPVETVAEPVATKNDFRIQPKLKANKSPKASVVVSPIRKIRSIEDSKKSDLSIQQDYSKKNDSGNNGLRADTVLLVILCFLLPPLAVYLYEGSWTSRCTVNLILTLLCGIPGVIHGLIVVLS